MQKGKSALNQFFMFLWIFFYPISFDLGYGIRFSDLIMCFTAFVAFILFPIRISRDVLITTAIIVIYLVLSSFLNIAIGRAPTTNGYLLSTKILINVIFLIQAMSSIKKLNDKQLRNVISFFQLVGCGLCVWALYSFIISPFLRVGFPFSFSNEIPDSHALGSLLTLYFIFLVSLQPFLKNKFKLYSIILLIITFLAIFTTGTRSILIIMPLFFIISNIRNILAGSLVKVLTICTFMILVIIFILSIQIDFSVSDIRSLSFDVAGPSEAKRISRFSIVFAELDKTLYTFGRGLLFVNPLYFDGTITFILYNFAIPGVLLYLIFLGYNLFTFFKYGRLDKLFLFLALISIIVSEFFLLSRWLIPVTIGYLILKELQIRMIKV